LSPDLKTGKTIAIFRHAGKSSFERLGFIRDVKGFT
jgi:hypothetical protein